MARLHLTVEGQTEQTFARDVLEPHLAHYQVYLRGVRLAAVSRKRGQVHRGGMHSYEPVKNDIARWLKEDRNKDVFFSTMLDLYRLPKTFPAYAEAKKLIDPYQRVVQLETAFQQDLGDRRFIPYLQLHEFEALLLADPKAFGSYYHQHDREIQRLVELVEEFNDKPETINDREHAHPAMRIARHIPEYLDEKPAAGPLIAGRIGLDKIRAKCPHFDQWLTKLEQLGRLQKDIP